MTIVRIPNEWTPRVYQRPLYNRFGHGRDFKRGSVIWHRRAGKDSTVLNLTAREMFTRVGTYWHLFPEQAQARKAIWNGIDGEGRRIIDQFMPPNARHEASPKQEQEMLLRAANGSTWQLAGSDSYDALVGSNPVGVVFSEWALANPAAWDYIRPILLENGGWALFITTPRGRNHAYQTHMLAQASPDWFDDIRTVDNTGRITSAQIDEERASGMSEAKVQQEYFCFKPDAMVACHDQVKPIADVRKGDIVLTHTGRMRRVTGTISRPYDGDMITISAFGGRDIVCTPNHPVQVCEPASQTYKWVSAENVEKGDYLVTPKMKTGISVLRPELARVIAWYVCEGSAAKTCVQFSIGAHEPEYADELCQDLRAIGFLPKRLRSGSVELVHVASVELADFLIGACGSLSHNKRLPLSMLRGNEQGVWEVLFKGDGCVHFPKKGKKPVYAYTTVSEGLAQQVQILGACLGFAGSYTKTDNNSSEIMGRAVKCRASYCVQMRQADKRRDAAPRTRSAKNGVLGKVRKVLRKKYIGDVHNFSVQYDESYVVNARAVHNCSFDAEADEQFMPSDAVGEARKREVYIEASDPTIIGVDCARFGDDSSVIQVRRGFDARTVPPMIFDKIDTMQLAGHVATAMDTHNADVVFVDEGGLGAGVVDRLRQMNRNVMGVNFGWKPDTPRTGVPKVVDKRTEMWAVMREDLKAGLAIHDNDRLMFELLAPSYQYDPHNAIKLESKKDMKKRGVASPDIADALALTYAYPVQGQTAEHQLQTMADESYDPFWSEP